MEGFGPGGGAERRTVASPQSSCPQRRRSLTSLPVGEASLCFLDKLTVGRREARVRRGLTDTVYVLL